MKLTRRQLVTAAAGSAIAAKALAQTGSGAPSGPRDFAKEARDGVERNGDALAKFAIPISTEPAFQFKA